ncbi:MAG: endonuclease III domain-containing protein [Thermoplasmatota archaeon]
MPRETNAAKAARALAIVDGLKEAYSDSRCALRHDTPFQLLIATALSAQTTDLAVNKATSGLFADFPDPAAMAAAPEEAIASHINGIGLWRTKAKNARAAAQAIMDRFDGAMPETVEQLISLPGVGRKTATAVLGQTMGAVGITVDTHMLRINPLLRLSKQTDPNKMARELERWIPQEEWVAYTHRIIDHGRLVCVARRPRCGICPVAQLCPSAGSEKAGYKPENDRKLPGSAKGLSWISLGDGEVPAWALG